MSSEWKISSVEDLVQAGVLAPPIDGNHGEIHPKAADFVSHGVPFIMASDMKDGRVDTETCAFITAEQALSLRKGFAKAGDVLLSHKATLGRTAMVEPNAFEFLVLTPQVTYYRVLEPAKLNNRYLKYYFDSSPFQRTLADWAGAGSTRAYLGITAQRKLPIVLPPVAVQNSIAATIGALDDRIALLRETNATLEAIAQALFKSWFVDFDPVHAKQQGIAPAGMDEARAALFPDSFEDSSLGSKPHGWIASSLYDLAAYINGAAYKAFEPNLERRGLPIIKIAELKAGVTTQTAFSDVAMPEKYRIKTGDILFSWSGNPDTSIDTFVWNCGDGWLNQHIFRVLPHSEEERSFLLRALRHLRPVFAELARNKQTTGLGHVTIADMKRLQIIKPSRAVLDQFNEIVSPIHSRIFSNEQQAQTLVTLRDTLLPRLISGQLRLPEAQAELADATA